MNILLSSKKLADQPAIAILRIGTGLLMALAIGLRKLLNYQEMAANFPDPLGVGSDVSLMLTVFAEFFCALFLALGLFMRFALLPLIFTMIVAALIIHSEDAFHVKEHALIYLVIFTSLFLLGPGKYSLDHYILKNKIQ